MSKTQYVAESGSSRCGDPFFSTYSCGKPSGFCSLQAVKCCGEPEAGACDGGCEERIEEASISVSSWMVMARSCVTRSCVPVASLGVDAPVSLLPDMCDERVAEGQANEEQVSTCERVPR